MSFTTWSALYKQMKDHLAEYLLTGEWQTKRYRIGDQEHELHDYKSFMQWFKEVEKRARPQRRRVKLKNGRRF